MILWVVAFLGGALTILNQYILPVLPFVLARTEQPFSRSTLPLLIGMAGTFAAISTLAAVGGGWAVRVNDYGRIVAMVLLTLSAVALLSRPVADWLTRPLVALGGRLVSNDGARSGVPAALLLGVATGLLWAPCAGPILGLILTGAAIRGPSAHTVFLLLAFALGAGTSLALALLAGNKVFSLMKRSLGAEEWIRRGLGVAVLAGVVAIAFGWDTGILRRLSLSSTSGIEQKLLDRFHPVAYARTGENAPAAPAQVQLGNEGPMPSLDGAIAWLN